jgi:uncharacterized membrane protein
MTAPALVSWAGYLGWLNLSSSPFYFLASRTALVILTAWALLELVLDKTDKLGNRTQPLGLIFRIVTGSLSGAAIYSAAGGAPYLGAIIGLAGAMTGTFGGFYSRRAIVQRTSVSDFWVAIAEDIIAIAIGLSFLFR